MKFITTESVKEGRFEKKELKKLRYTTPIHPRGEMAVAFTGSKKGADLFTKEALARTLSLPEGEMMAPADLKNFAKQAVVDIATGLAEHPTVYQYIFDIIKNEDFPRNVLARDIVGAQAAFSIVNPGESIPLADFKLGKKETVELKTFAAGYSLSQDMALFDEFWKVSQMNKALGIAANTALDHVHLSPLFTHSYSGKALTSKVSTGKTDLENVWLTLRKGLQDALGRSNAHGYRLRPTIALCNSATAMDVEAAVHGMLQKGSQLGALGQIKTVLAYDGWEGEVAGVKYAFKAPENGEVYLIMPKAGFKSLVKQELTQLKQRGNVLTLSELDVAQTFTLAPVLDLQNSVHKVKLS